jgi:hypothetical protein
VNDIATGAPLDILAPKVAPIECMPAIMDLDLLPDMGRMTERLLSGAAHGCSPVQAVAAAMYTLIGTAKLNGVDPQAWLADVLRRIADHPASRLHELLPWNWKLRQIPAAAA